MKKLLMIIYFPFCFSSPFTEVPKCDKQIINKINRSFWNGGCCKPRDLIETADFIGPGAAIRATKDLYTDEENISCIYSIFQGSVATLYTQFTNSTSIYVTGEVSDVEYPGYLFEPATGIFRYNLYSNRLGVTAIYKCNLTGLDGDPQGLVKVSSIGYVEDAVDQAVTDLASLGIVMSEKVFDVTCFN